MLEKNRLEELIKQGATVYIPDDLWQTIGTIKLNKKCYLENGRLNNNDITFEDLPNASATYSIPFEDLYETKEDAEWALDFGNITRTETLSLPSWKEIENDLKNCSDGDYVIVDDDRVTFVYYKLKKKPKLSIITNFDATEVDATKENYIEACELCRKLFLGEVEE